MNATDSTVDTVKCACFYCGSSQGVTLGEDHDSRCPRFRVFIGNASTARLVRVGSDEWVKLFKASAQEVQS